MQPSFVSYHIQMGMVIAQVMHISQSALSLAGFLSLPLKDDFIYSNKC